MSDPKLGKRACQCSACLKYFKTDSAFDKHRTGSYPDRRCLTDDELAAAGWSISIEGYWRKPAPKNAFAGRKRA